MGEREERMDELQQLIKDSQSMREVERAMGKLADLALADHKQTPPKAAQTQSPPKAASGPKAAQTPPNAQSLPKAASGPKAALPEEEWSRARGAAPGFSVGDQVTAFLLDVGKFVNKCESRGQLEGQTMYVRRIEGETLVVHENKDPSDDRSEHHDDYFDWDDDFSCGCDGCCNRVYRLCWTGIRGLYYHTWQKTQTPYNPIEFVELIPAMGNGLPLPAPNPMLFECKAIPWAVSQLGGFGSYLAQRDAPRTPLIFEAISSLPNELAGLIDGYAVSVPPDIATGDKLTISGWSDKWTVDGVADGGNIVLLRIPEWIRPFADMDWEQHPRAQWAIRTAENLWQVFGAPGPFAIIAIDRPKR